MKIVIAGGTGFLGAALASRLSGDGHDVVVLTRQPSHARDSFRAVHWDPDGGAGSWATEVDGAHAVVNLAGQSIAAGRWSAARKQTILDSRLRATRSLVEAIRGARTPPPVLVSGSATGYYGPRDDERLSEDAGAGSDFLARVCSEWEAEASRAATPATRVAVLRTGLVIERDGGALPKIAPPFKLGVGGPLGSGRQYWPWIHRADWVDLACWIMRTPQATGPLNATAPAPVTNAEFSQALGRAMHRPSWMPAPAFALRLGLGEMADALLLSGQRAVPAKAERLGFRFRYPDIDGAFAAMFGTRRNGPD